MQVDQVTVWRLSFFFLIPLHIVGMFTLVLLPTGWWIPIIGVATLTAGVLGLLGVANYNLPEKGAQQ